MTEKTVFLTEEGLAKLKAELEHLIAVRRQEVAERIRNSMDMAHPDNNPEYEDAKSERAFVEGRIIELERMLKNVSIIPTDGKKTGRVKIGDRVKVRSENGTEKEYTILGVSESNPAQGKISYKSPIGQALLDKKVGEVIEISVPAGTTKLTLLSIG